MLCFAAAAATPYTLRPKPDSLSSNPTPYGLSSNPYTLRPKPYTLSSNPINPK